MRGVGGLLLLVLVLGAIVRFWWVLAAALAVAITAAVLWCFTGWLDRRLDARDRRRGALCAGTTRGARRRTERGVSGRR